jgi:tripartite-type tricarboxylate transporter receptor subunit TctC
MSRLFYWLATAAFLALAPLALAQDAWPGKTITIVVPYAPGGVTDSIARLVSPLLKDSLGQSVVIENKPGGGGTVGTELVAKSKADGYTLLMVIEQLTIAPELYRNEALDPLKNLAPITLMAKAPQVIVAHPSFAPGTLSEAIAASKPQSVFYASSGNGTAHHLAMEQLKLLTKANFEHVPYKGGGQAITDLVAGQVKLGIIGVAPALPHIKAGKLKAIAVTSTSRLAVLPDTPTVIEAGIPNFETFNWFGILAPIGTPKPVIDKLHAAIVKAMNSPELAPRFAAMSLDIVTSPNPADFSKFLVEDQRKWPPIVQAGNIKAD